MSTNDTGGPAFPLPITRDPEGGIFDPRGYGAEGMTLRDYFAAQALASMLANPDKEGAKRGKAGLMFFPGYAYEWADAMLKARNE